MTRRTLSFVFLAVFAVMPCIAQPAGLAIIAKGGLSFYGGLHIGNFGGGSGIYWESGPAFAAGIEYPVTRRLALQGMIEYSTHGYVKQLWGYTVQDNPHNWFIELDLNSKLAFGPFYAIAGISFYRQTVDGVVLRTPHGVESEGVRESKTNVGSSVGIGLSIQVASDVALFAEGSLRMRQYVTPVLQIGSKIVI